MALEDQDIIRIMTSIRTVVQDEVKATVEPMEERLNQRFDMVPTEEVAAQGER